MKKQRYLHFLKERQEAIKQQRTPELTSSKGKTSNMFKVMGPASTMHQGLLHSKNLELL